MLILSAYSFLSPVHLILTHKAKLKKYRKGGDLVLEHRFGGEYKTAVLSVDYGSSFSGEQLDLSVGKVLMEYFCLQEAHGHVIPLARVLVSM